MQINFNVTGSERKRLVAAMGDILGSKPNYLGAPSFAYEVDYFTIDTNGTVSFDDRADSEKFKTSSSGCKKRVLRWLQPIRKTKISLCASKCRALPSLTRR